MDELDRELAKLDLMKNADLKPSTMMPGSSTNSSSSPGKKVGPAVPPKPKKSQSQQPQIPQSYPLKQSVEPSYASRIQANQLYSNVPPPKPPSHYSNTPTLPANSKFQGQHLPDNNYANLPRDGDRGSQYSNLPRSGSVMSSASLPRQGSAMACYGSNRSETSSLPRQNMSSPAPSTNPSVGSLGPRGYSKPDPVTYSNIQMRQPRNQDGIIYSNLMHPPRNGGNVYSNASAYGNGDDLPPPPPPLDMSSGLGDYAPCTVNTNLPPPPEDLLPPPSPVSSSYSELRRATQPGQDFHNYSTESQFEDSDSLYGYGTISQSSSNSGSVYGPFPQEMLPRLNIALSTGNNDPLCENVYESVKSPSESPSESSSSSGSKTAESSPSGSKEHIYEPIRSISYSSPISSSNYSLTGQCTSRASSTYESIYEPINPRPPSQMSSRSNYSLYAPYVSGASSTMTGPSQSVSRIGHNKEQEVDSLTDLLVQGMRGVGGDADQEDVYGLCVKCGEKIIGENSGCTAMDQLYHTHCFTCHHCAINLQGKPFYALDGNPYCEEDYLNTLEKCSVCQKPILDRILRATGKPYHPQCFCCVVCGKSLDGIPFTVDAMNRIHCIEDFHKMFAPRCWVCKQPIMPEPGEEETVRVVALDHSFHIQCYKCEDCGLVLSSEAEGRGCYPLDGHVLCKSCNAKRVQALTSHMTTEL